MCVGLKNMKIFIQYLFIAAMTTLYMVVSLIIIATLESSKIEELSDLQLTLFAVFEIVIGASVLLFAK